MAMFLGRFELDQKLISDRAEEDWGVLLRTLIYDNRPTEFCARWAIRS